MIQAEPLNEEKNMPNRARLASERLRRIDSRHNPLVKELRKTFAQGEPAADHTCAIEGFHILDEAIRSGLKFRAIFFSHSAEAKTERNARELYDRGIEAVKNSIDAGREVN